MEFRDKDLLPYDTDLVGFTEERILLKGYVEARLTLGQFGLEKTVQAKFLVIDLQCHSWTPLFEHFRGRCVNPHLVLMEFLDQQDRVVTLCGDQAAARSCSNISIKISSDPMPRKRSRLQHLFSKNDITP